MLRKLVQWVLFFTGTQCSPSSLNGRASSGPIGGVGFAEPGGVTGNKLTGRFLHITDIHPDPFYKPHSSTGADHVCHRGDGNAGRYGAETTECDSPYALVNETFRWIKDHLRNEVDFVIWTGDSARHDNDERIPRTQEHIVSQNEFIVDKFLQVWGKPDNYDDPDPSNDFMIPIVPTLGNNDILPHNIFLEGPNRWTRKFLDMWRQFVPEEQRHQFQRGGWFHVEVIPNKLAVISLNTLYFFAKNAAVDGCAPPAEPGYEQMDWLRIQLEIFRARGMKVMLMGHVPPARTANKQSWDETCWQKYTLWVEQYRDIVVGSFYGHMNIDHFIIQDFNDIKKSTRNGAISDMGVDDDVATASEKSYLVDLRDLWSDLVAIAGSDSEHSEGEDGGAKHQEDLDSIGGQFGERFAVSHVSPSVVPNYFPAFRVYEYNITGLGLGLVDLASTGWADTAKTAAPGAAATRDLHPADRASDEWSDEYCSAVEKARQVVSTDDSEANKKKKKKKKKKKSKKYKFYLPSPPSSSAPPGPAYSPQTFSLVGYTQYYANLTQINAGSSSNVEAGSHFAPSTPQEVIGHVENAVRSNLKPNDFEFEIEYKTKEDKLYGMDNLLVRSYIDLAERIGQKKKGETSNEDGNQVDTDQERDVRNPGDGVETDKKGKKHKKKKKKHKGKMNKVWLGFVKRAFVGTMDPEEIEEYFGEVVNGDHDTQTKQVQGTLEL